MPSQTGLDQCQYSQGIAPSRRRRRSEIDRSAQSRDILVAPAALQGSDHRQMRREQGDELGIGRLGVGERGSEQRARIGRAPGRQQRVGACGDDLGARRWARSQLERFFEHAECRGVAQPRERVAERAQQLRALRRAGPLAQRAPQVGDGRLGSPAGQCHPPGFAQRSQRPLLAHGLGGEQVVRDRLGPGVGPCEQRRRPSVLGGAHGRGDVEIDGSSQERMGEGRRATVREHARPDQGRKGCDGRVAPDPRERAGETELAAVAEHGHGARQLTGGRLQPAEPRQHRGPQAIAREDIDTSRAVLVGRKTRFAHARKQLLQQPGIAARGGVARAHECGGGRRVRAPRDQLAHPLRAQGLQPPHTDTGDRKRPCGAGLARSGPATGRQERDRKPVDAAREIGEPAQRRRVAPVQVVGQEQHGPFLRDRGEQPVEAVDHRRGVGLALPRVVEDRAGWTRGARQPAPPGRCRGLAQRGVEHLPHEPEAELALDLAAAPAEDAVPGRELLARLQQRRLADAGGPLEQQRAAIAARSAFQQGRQFGQFGLAIDQPVAHVANGARCGLARWHRRWCHPAARRPSAQLGEPHLIAREVPESRVDAVRLLGGLLRELDAAGLELLVGRLDIVGGEEEPACGALRHERLELLGRLGIEHGRALAPSSA